MKKEQEPKTLAERAQSYMKENTFLLKKYKLTSRVLILFPRKRVPILSRLALWVVSKQGGRIDIQFGDTSNLK